MTRWIATIAVAAACASTSSRGTAPEKRVGSQAPAPSQAARRAARIDAVMKEWANDDSPGCAVAVIQDREIVHAKGYGMADLEHGVPITPETVFDIASISKQFTASAVLLAAAEGKLQLDDDVRMHVPALPQLGKTPTTIRRLLHHTGGLRDYITLLVLGGGRPDGIATVRETIDVLARQRGLDFEPGTKHEYSNTGYFILAQAVEHATQQSLATYLEARIFAPLDMTRTQVLDDPKRIVPGRAIGYAPRDDGWRIEVSGWAQTGDGAVNTTVVDLAKWDANFYDPKVGGTPLIDGLQTRGKLEDGTQLDYAAGLVHGNYRGQPTVWHSGGWAGYRAQFERFPALKTSIAVLCNAASAQPGELAHRIADVVLERHLAAEPPTAHAGPSVQLTTAELDAWVGTFRRMKTGELITVARNDDSLALTGVGEVFVLTLTSARTSRLGPTPIVVELDGTRPRRKLTLKGESFDEELDEVELAKPTDRQLAALAGRYRSDEIDTEWKLSVSGATLVATGRAFDEPAALTGPFHGEFSIAALGATLRFTRDKRGGITGFALGLGSMRGIRFDRVP